MRRIVLDTNVVLSALLWRGTPYSLLQHIASDTQCQLFTSPALIDELADVLSRPALLKRLHLINRSTLDVLGDYVRASTVLTPPPLPQSVCRDPDDDALLALARFVRADLVVSGDQDVLVLHPFEGVPILAAHAALTLLQQSG